MITTWNGPQRFVIADYSSENTQDVWFFDTAAEAWEFCIDQIETFLGDYQEGDIRLTRCSGPDGFWIHNERYDIELCLKIEAAPAHWQPSGEAA